LDLVVPDLGNFADILVVDVLIKPGDAVEVDAPLVTLETDKASMDVPATAAGTVTEVLLKRGDKVSKGSIIARLEMSSQSEPQATFSAAFDAEELERTVRQPTLSASAVAAQQAAETRRERPVRAGDGVSASTDRAGASGVAPVEAESASSGDRARKPNSPDNASAAESARSPDNASAAESARSPDRADSAPRPEAVGDTVRMPVPDLQLRDRGNAEFNRATQLLVLGSGPGGYTAAFRGADLGMQVTLVERWSVLGGVCLNVGCIPSKALLHAAKVIEDAEAMGANGIAFGDPAIDLSKLRAWKSGVVRKLTGGLRMLAKQRKVEVVQGVGRFVSPNVLEVMGSSGSERIRFEACIIAAGSEAIRLPGLPSDPRVMDSADALELPEFSGGLLVIGGGIIGLEMACVYDGLGSRVSVVEMTSQLMPGCDPDLVRPLERRIRGRYQQILLNTKVAGVEPLQQGLRVTFEGERAPAPQMFDRVLVAVGRVPNGKAVGADAAGVTVSERGFIPVDKQMRTNVPHIFAIGDIASAPMLAHKAMHEAKVAAEVAAGHKSAFDARVIPSVAYTDPEIAWVGLTETQAQAQGIPVRKGAFPWVANGRSLSLGREEGFTKLLFDPDTHRVLGAGIVGTNAGDLISEAALAIETGADAADIGLTIHPHPTLSETIAGAAEAVEGTLTDLYIPKK
jgi:dihydrolipoamide dehydrogenase